MTAGETGFLYLTTTGRRSGRPREIEIWFTQHEGCYYLVAEHREKTQWVQNVRANPAVRARVGNSEFNATARVVEAQTEPALHKTIQALSKKKYGWGNGLVVEITPARQV